MEPERVQALRDTKALYDEGILYEAEYKAKKKELLAAPPAKTFDECAFVAPKKTEQLFEPSTAFERRKGLGARRGWDARITRDPEDAAEISELVNKAYAADFGSGGFRAVSYTHLTLPTICSV